MGDHEDEPKPAEDIDGIKENRETLKTYGDIYSLYTLVSRVWKKFHSTSKRHNKGGIFYSLFYTSSLLRKEELHLPSE
jgi:hypothetical protein